MTTDRTGAVPLLQRAYLQQYPGEATQLLEKLPAAEIARILGAMPLESSLPVWERLVPDIAAQALEALPALHARGLLSRANPNRCATWLAALEPEVSERYLDRLEVGRAADLRLLMTFPPDCAGSLMDPRVLVFRPAMTVREAMRRLRDSRRQDILSLFVLDADNRLAGFIPIQVLAMSRASERLEALMLPVRAFVEALAPRDELVDRLDEYRLIDLPVIDRDGRLLGVVPPQALVAAVENEASATLQTMVGSSKEERALSRVTFAVRKRQPWLQINLLTAFLAAAVVGLFETTIAQFTALAVLLPVVAGQSGNTGAQAMAVTMRGLALREISARHWGQLIAKEAAAASLNGLAIAGVTSLGVWLWSGSYGLVLVICLAMVLSMVIAGMAGATIPVLLTMLGQDPAQSSSIFLTTVTDVVGMFSFLGLATLLSGLL